MENLKGKKLVTVDNLGRATLDRDIDSADCAYQGDPNVRYICTISQAIREGFFKLEDSRGKNLTAKEIYNYYY